MITAVRDYFVTAFAELQKVVWPTRREVIRHTVTITISVVIALIILGLIDYGLTSLLKTILARQA